ncbi:Glycosyltransferase [Rhynchospora pubera]|uniref:Glycosyltransferase n=2 Tax=Rhynchospora pubera TaxID=906938 RepID=A0AAV8ERY6_9POAL|nr:Glycosyltransferase [Rhynchospora pubera]
MANELKTQSNQPENYQHFLIVTQPSQGHINPARYLAYRLLSLIPSCHVTLSTAISAHRRMFPSLPVPDQEMTIRQVSYIPFSDGYDSGFEPSFDDRIERIKKLASFAPKSLSAIIDRLAERGRPVTCIIHALFFPWMVDLALAYGVPSILYWIQPAMILSTYYHYFNGHESIILSHKDDRDFTLSLPGLFPLKICDLPSFLTITSDDHPHKIFIGMFRDMFESLDRERSITGSKPKILVNSFETLEADLLQSMEKYFELYTIGPLIQSSAKDEEEKNNDYFQVDDENKHMNWLDSKPEKSVVYVSFGGLTMVSKEQLEEVQLGLKASGLPYIWVVRKNSRVQGLVLEDDRSNGIIVEWCDQVKVLSHSSIGCFVTHHGWNSTLEGIMCGVPMVGVPQWSDQMMNAKLAEEIGVGVRCRFSEEKGVVVGSELMRCLKLVMIDDATRIEKRCKAEFWKNKVREAMESGGSSEINLKAFVKTIANMKKSE